MVRAHCVTERFPSPYPQPRTCADFRHAHAPNGHVILETLHTPNYAPWRRPDAPVTALQVFAWVPHPLWGWGTDSTGDTAGSLPVVFANTFHSPPLEGAGHPVSLGRSWRLRDSLGIEIVPPGRVRLGPPAPRSLVQVQPPAIMSDADRG